jgi:uracil-DNA glycosylase
MKIHEQIPADWLNLLLETWSLEELITWSKQMENLLAQEKITPPVSQIFKALEECTIENTKVVILGQDPYPTPGHANGMAFSTEDFVQPFPKSLLNIFKELKRSIPGYDFPLKGNLAPWARQGVLLLNTCLTTIEGTANAHKNKGWENLTHTLLQSLFSKKKNLVGMFWGKQAQEISNHLPEKDHLFLESSHPSPLSVYRGFNSCNHFVLCNEYLLKLDKKAIDWQT